jgi:surface protein
VRKNNGIYIGSRTSPKGSSRACLCWDTNTYSISCCDGSIQSQGIGSITGVAQVPRTPLTNATFNQAITDILLEEPNGNYDLAPYGKIQDWDVSQVTDMSNAFSETNFNGDISNWNVNQVTTMAYMFYDNEDFNQDINSWNTGSVITMEGMFQGALAFDKPMGFLDVSNVTNMYGMFQGAFLFNQDIESWITGNVNTMAYMFSFASNFNQDLSSWDVINVLNCFDFSNSTPNWNLPKPNFTNCTP